MLKRVIHQSALILTALFILSVFSCSKNDDLGNLNDTIIVRHKNADMPAYIHGNGKEKVFLITLHGGPGDLGLVFRTSTFKNKIEKTYAVVYFDQRGSGMSQGNYSESEISVDIMAQDILALVKVLKKKYGNSSRFFLMGHSWGATLGIATLLKNQNEFLGWMQVDGTHNPKGMYSEYLSNFERVAAEQIMLGNSVSFWQETNELVNNVASEFNEDDFFKLNNRAFKAEEKLHDDDVINKSNNNSNLFFNYNLITAFWNRGNVQSIIDPEIRNLSFTSRLTEINIPSLILWGKHDMVVPPIYAQEAFDKLGSTIKKQVIFERSGHSPIFSEANQFAEEVILFIDQNK